MPKPKEPELRLLEAAEEFIEQAHAYAKTSNDVDMMRVVQRALVLLARDATDAAAALYAPIREAESAQEVQRLKQSQ
jgi:phosphoserine phosphatase